MSNKVEQFRQVVDELMRLGSSPGMIAALLLVFLIALVSVAGLGIWAFGIKGG